jgi:cell division protein FtsI/penicillin-binding protein 2
VAEAAREPRPSLGARLRGFVAGALSGRPAPGAETDVATDARRLALRLKVVAATVLGLYALLGGRLYTRQVAEAQRWTELAAAQQRPLREVPAYRGDVRTRDGLVLARSVRAKSAFAEPRFMGARRGLEPPTDADLDAAARAIGEALGYDAARTRTLRARFVDERGAPRGFVWIERRLEPERAERLRAAKVQGVSWKDEYRREYPQGTLAAQVIGLVKLSGDGDLSGRSGVEAMFEAELRGVDGLREVVRDAKGGAILEEGALEVPPEDGATVTLTIDGVIQAAAERAIARGAAEWTPKGISCTVYEVGTGRLLALASWPTYDPATCAGLDEESMRFRPALDTFEPGSIVKPLIVALALEAGAVKANASFDCTSPRRVVTRRVVDKHPKNGWQGLPVILAFSLNCGMVQIAPLLGPERLHDGLSRCGFGEGTGLGFAGEPRGSIPPLSRWRARWGFHSTVSVAQGYEMTVTQVQMASAFAALGNGGVRLRPQVVERVEDGRGALVRGFAPVEAARIVSESHLRATILPALEKAVLEGTGKRARLEGWRVGGKTGTAKLLVGRGYDSTRNRASFVGMAPIEAPRIVVAVTVEDPRSKGFDPSGGAVAAPIAKEVLAEVLPYLRVPRSAPREGE